MSDEREIQGRLEHLGEALRGAMLVIADIERELADLTARHEHLRASQPFADEGAFGSGGHASPVYPDAVSAASPEPRQETSAGGSPAESVPPAGPPGPPWAYVLPPWAWPGATLWWQALMSGWPIGPTPPWGWGTGQPAPHPGYGWPPATPPWWSGGPVPGHPAGPRPRRDEGREEGPETSGADAPEDLEREPGTGDAPETAANARRAPGAAAPPAPRRELSPEERVWRWSHPEDLHR